MPRSCGALLGILLLSGCGRAGAGDEVRAAPPPRADNADAAAPKAGAALQTVIDEDTRLLPGPAAARAAAVAAVVRRRRLEPVPEAQELEAGPWSGLPGNEDLCKLLEPDWTEKAGCKLRGNRFARTLTIGAVKATKGAGDKGRTYLAVAYAPDEPGTAIMKDPSGAFVVVRAVPRPRVAVALPYRPCARADSGAPGRAAGGGAAKAYRLLFVPLADDTVPVEVLSPTYEATTTEPAPPAPTRAPQECRA